MNDQTDKLDQVDEDILTNDAVSDEALEVAGTDREPIFYSYGSGYSVYSPCC
jgi:hypothetical protein